MKSVCVDMFDFEFFLLTGRAIDMWKTQHALERYNSEIFSLLPLKRAMHDGS